MTHELRARLALEKYGFRFTHSLGQNFLLDDQGAVDFEATQSGKRARRPLGPASGPIAAWNTGMA